MESSGATPISLTADSCSGQEGRCHIATPAPSTPFPYSPMSPYGPINPYSFMSRYSASGAPHLQSAFSSPLASSLAAGLAYPADLFHYNPYSALTPTSPLTPSSFWSLTAQQSFHQLNGITFGPSGPVGYNTNAHLFNLFSPNSLSSMSPSPDLHSPSLYPRVSSMPSPYASSPGLSSAFMSPSSMPLLLSPSLSSNVDRPPTYLSDNASTPSSTPSMTPSIKCEPIEHNCGPQLTSQTLTVNLNDNSVDKSDSNDRHSDKVNRSVDRHHKKHNINTHNKQSLNKSMDSETKQESHEKITTTITTSMTKVREKNSVRVEPLVRDDPTIEMVAHNGNGNDVCDRLDKPTDDKHINLKRCETSIEKLVDVTQNSEESLNKTDIDDTNKVNKEVKLVNPRVKRELIECDMRLPSNSVESVKSVPNCDDINSDLYNDSNPKNVIAKVDSNSSPLQNQMITLVTESKLDEITGKNLSIDDSSNSNTSDGRQLTIVCNSADISSGDSASPKVVTETKKAKETKRESQLKQLQSYRKESHRTKANKPLVNGIPGRTVNGIESGAAISIVLPKPKDQINGEHKKPFSGKLANQSPSPSAPTVCSTQTTVKPTPTPPVSSQSKVQSKTGVVTCCTKPVPKLTDNNILNSGANIVNPLVDQKSMKLDKPLTNGPNAANGSKLSSNVTKQLPKKPRISRKPPSTGIPVGIAIAQQRTSPKTKSPNESAANASQLKPILPTLSLPMMTNSPILITDSPPAGTSLWIKPTTNSTVTNTSSIQSNSQFSLGGDYQLARDSLTGHLYLIRNSSSLPSTPTATTGPKPPALIPPLNIKGDQSKSSPSAIITLPVGAAQPQQFFASLGQTQASTLILDTASSAPLVQIAATPVPGHNLNPTALGVKCVGHSHSIDPKSNVSANNSDLNNSSVNVERGCQASISDDELTCDNIKTTATQVDMDAIHSSEEDDENDGKCHKLRLFSERRNKVSDKKSVNDDESSRDSLQLEIVDEMASEEPPQLPVKSAPVMQFIDHHGLDLLVDSIEEFAAREETSPATTDLPVNGLQLLSTLAEQRSLEERSANEASALRRHSADSSIAINGLYSSTNTCMEANPAKRRQRSESCFTTNPIKFDENGELFSDIKKLMKTSSSQTDKRKAQTTDTSLGLRRSERIFINDSFVFNGTTNGLNGSPKDIKVCNKEVSEESIKGIDAIEEKDLSNASDLKRKENSEPKCKPIGVEAKANNEKHSSSADPSMKTKPKDQYVFTGTKCDEMVSNLNTFSVISNKPKINDNFVFCDISKSNNQKSVSDSTKDKAINFEKISDVKIKKKKKKKTVDNALNSSQTDEKKEKTKKRKKKPMEWMDNNKKLKSNCDKQIDDSIDAIIKRVSQIDETIDVSHSDHSPDEVDKSVVETKICDQKSKLEEISANDEHKERKKRPMIKQSFELYDQKRMKLLDETIDEIIAKELISSEESAEQLDDQKDSHIEEPKAEPTEVSISSNDVSTAKEHKTIEVSPKSETSKAKQLVKQPSTTSSICSSATSSSSDSCNSSPVSPNLKLSESDLDLKLNVIMLVDGLLFVGEICPIQPPDIYGIILHGERQHRPIIYSQEQMLREAIREVKPTLEELEEGQRVCAYWSTQYRHLYPGFVRSSSPHPNLVFIEFDDGDNGRIAIDDIRLLPQDYPKMEINADPMKNLERRRRMSSCGKDNRNGKHASDNTSDRPEEKKDELNNSYKASINDEVKSNAVKESNKKDKDMKNKSNKSCNTVSDKTKSNDSISNNKSNIKLEVKKKKKKHNKEDRHHRHHHNHKHHHCRHHRKCKKHKKSKEEVNTNISHSSSSNSLNNDSKSDTKTEKTNENNTKSTKTIATKTNLKESKHETKGTDAQNALDNKLTENKSANEETEDEEPKKDLKKPLRTVIKKTPEQRALDRLQTNLSESFITISSPIRAVKRLNTENATSATPKKRERMPSAEKSKIAAFLPHRQLWHWSGKYIRRTGNKGSRTRKVYFREIERGRERIKVDDCAVFLSTGRPHLPYIGRIDSMWQTGSGTMMVKVRWFYHPEETKGQPVPLLDKRGALFESSHFDVNDVQTISHRCQVISWTEYQEKRRENPLITTEDPPNVYYSAGKYDALAGHVDMDSTVPLKDRSTVSNTNADNNEKTSDK